MLTGHLLIEPNFFARYSAERENALRDYTNKSYIDMLEDKLAQARNILSFDEEGNASIKITGPLSKEGPDIVDMHTGAGGTSYEDIADALEEALHMTDDSHKISLLFDTPGGSVYGLDETYQAIRLVGRDRNIEAQVGSMAASAGYYLASAANTITTTSPNSMVGSIGVVVTTYDTEDMLKSFGVNKITIVNSASPNKRPDLKTEDGRSIVRKELDDLYKVFSRRVIQGRRGRMDQASIDGLQGTMVLAEEGLQIGLVDKVTDAASEMVSNVAANQQVPALAGEVKTSEVELMGLKELIAENPDLAAEVEAIKAESFEAGCGKGKKELLEDIGNSVEFLLSDSYPVPIKQLAADVITGKEQRGSLRAAVAAYDATKEKAKETEAVKATEEIGETVAEQKPQLSNDGTIKSQEDFFAEARKIKTGVR